MTESSEAELSAAPIVVACFCRKIRSSAEHLRYAGDNGIKKHINLSFDTTTIDAKEDISNRSMREAIWTMYPIGRRQGEIHKLWRFYESAKVAVGKAKREPDAMLSVSTLTSFLDGDEIECDFFAYVDESPVSPKQISWTQEERWKPRRELSPEGAMKVFLILTQSILQTIAPPHQRRLLPLRHAKSSPTLPVLVTGDVVQRLNVSGSSVTFYPPFHLSKISNSRTFDNVPSKRSSI